jgi:hypothetical protein
VGVVLTSTRSEPDWPADLDPFSGTYIYYGDNRRPGMVTRLVAPWRVSGNPG